MHLPEAWPTVRGFRLPYRLYRKRGIERPNGRLPLTVLKLQRSGLRKGLAWQASKVEGDCCRGGKNCGVEASRRTVAYAALV